jgi:hypothetical protein
MAEGAKRIYTTDFLIGARLLGSFKTTMAAAQSRMKSLNSGLLRIGGGLKKLAIGFTAIGGIIGAFGIGHMFENMFEGATEAFEQAEQRTLRLTSALRMHDEIRAKGIEYAETLSHVILDQNKGLAAQGIMSKAILDTASSTLAVYGYAPKRIPALTERLGDVLAASKGVAATTEDMATLTKAWGTAVKTGMTRQLRGFGIVIDKPTQKVISKLAKGGDFAGIQKWLMKATEGLAGWSKHVADTTDSGKLVKMKNQLAMMRVEIGEKMLPVQAKFAEMWLKILPVAGPVILKIQDMLADFVTGTAVPKLTELVTFLQGPAFGKAWDNLKQLAGDAFGKIGTAFGHMLASMGIKTDDFKGGAGDAFLKVIGHIGNAFKWVGDNAEWLLPLVRDLAIGFAALDLVLGVAGLLNPLTLTVGLLIAAGVAAAELSAHLEELRGRDDVLGSIARGLKEFDDWYSPKVRARIMSTGKAIGAGASATASFWDKLGQRAAGMTNTNRMAPILSPNVPMFAGGGIFSRPTLGVIGERGPEAVIPLSRGGLRKDGDTIVNFSPQITIQGNATEETVAALDRGMRDWRRDFISEFKAAQNQARRLSYESGYG